MAQKKKRKTSNVILLLLGLFIFAFIVTMIVIFWFKGAIPDTLVTCTLGASGLEGLLLAAIKISKVRAGEKEVTEDE